MSKHTFQRFCIFLLTFAVIVSLVAPATFVAGAAEGFTFSIANVETSATTVTVPVTVTNNPGINSWGFIVVTNDNDPLTFTGVSIPEQSINYYLDSENNRLVIFYAPSSGTVTVSSFVIYLNFSLSNETGTYPITLSHDSDNCYNNDWDLFDISTVTTIPGSVTIGSGTPEPTTYTVSATGIMGGGTVTADKNEYEAGDTVTLTVEPESGKRLKAQTLAVTKDGGGTVSLTDIGGGKYTFTMPADDVTVSAQFEAIPPTTYAVTIGTVTGGTLTIAGGKTEFEAGDTVSLTATPGDGYRLGTNNLTYNDGSDHTITGTSFTMPAHAVTVSAVFEAIPAEATKYAVTIGTITGDGTVAVTSGAAEFAEGATVNLTVTPGDGKQLKSGTLKYNSNVITGTNFTMPGEAVTITAEFEDIPAQTYTISIGTFDGGSVSASPSGPVPAGTLITLTVTPGSGKQLTVGSLKYNDTLVVGGVFTMPSANVTITAEFENAPETPDPFKVSVGYGGTVSKSNGVYTFTANEGYKVDVIYIDGVPLTAGSGVTLTGSSTVQGATQYAVDTNSGYDDVKSIVATFAYTINFNTPENGSLLVFRGDTQLELGAIVRGGETLRIVATPGTNYQLDTLTLVGLEKIGDDTYKVTSKRGEALPGVTVSFKGSATVTTGDPWVAADLVIYNEADLIAFAESVNAGNTYSGNVVRLAANLSISGDWIGIGMYRLVNKVWQQHPFSGTFDGDGYTINLALSGSTQQALFHYLSSATVKNLKTTGTVFSSYYTFSPVAAGIALISRNSQILNCVNAADITAEGYAAGIVGLSYYGNADTLPMPINSGSSGTYNSSNTLIQNCINLGKITSSSSAAGIANYANRVVNSGNEGDVSGSAANVMIGGVVGGYYNDKVQIVDGCYNKGNVTDNASSTFVGGIMGYGWNAQISNSYNTGNVAHTGNAAGVNGSSPCLVAGIVPTLSVHEYSASVYNCYNTGTISTAKQEGTTAGITGDIYIPSQSSTNVQVGGNGLPDALKSSSYASDGTLKWENANPTYRVTFTGDIATINGVEGTSFVLSAGTVGTFQSYSYTANNGASGTFHLTRGDKTIALTAQVTFIPVTGVTVEVKNVSNAIQTGTNGVYNSLPNGSYTYEVKQSGTKVDEGTFILSGVNRTITLADYSKERVDVTFAVNVSGASVTVKDSSGATIAPKNGQSYVYTLYKNENYTYSVSAQNYVPKTAIAFTATGDPINVTLVKQSVQITFSVVPGTATVVVKLGSQTVSPTSSNVYLLEQGVTYTYSVSLKDYVTENNSITVSAATTVTVNLKIENGKYPPGWDGARPSFGIYILNRDGTKGIQIGNWDYNPTLHTYVNPGTTTEAAFITDFTKDLTKYPFGAIVYSGIDKMPALRLGVVLKGIRAEDIIAYYNAHRTVTGGTTYPLLNKSTVAGFEVKVCDSPDSTDDPYLSNTPILVNPWDEGDKGPGQKLFPWESALDSLTGITRYYYPNFLLGPNTYAGIDKKQYTELGTGTPVTGVLSVIGYEDRLSRLPVELGLRDEMTSVSQITSRINYLKGIADDERALRVFDGMLPDNSTLPLGQNSSYYTGSVWIAPPYHDITVSGGTITYTGTVDYPRAVVGEVVTFTVNGTNQYTVKVDGTVKTATNGVYSFSMPDRNAAILIEEIVADPVKVADATISGDGTVTATISGANVAESQTSLTLTVNPAGTAGTTVGAVEIIIEADALAAIKDANIPLTIQTPLGDLTFDAAALSRITTNASGDAVELRLELEEATDTENTIAKELIAKGTPVYELTLWRISASGNTQIFTASGTGSVSVAIPYSASGANKTPRVYYIPGSGAKTLVPSTYSGGKVTFTTSHFSLYSIEEEEKQPVKAVASYNSATATVTATISGTDDVPDSLSVTASGTVKTVDITIDKDTVESVFGAAGKSLTLYTNLSDLTFDAASLKRIASQAGSGNNVELRIELDGSTNTYAKTLTGKGVSVYELTLWANGSRIFTGSGAGTVEIKIPYTRNDSKKGVVVYNVSESNGNKTEVEAYKFNQYDGYVNFETSHFSLYSIEEEKRGKGDPNATVWDGMAIDIEWFTKNPNAGTFYIGRPAELAGLAALVNGLYNEEIDTIVGDESYIRVNTGSATESGNNLSTETFHYGDYDFNGKTIILTADINMGSANYMPIGGQYLMTPNVSATRIDAGFNGTFDGDGHTVTLNADRHCSTGNFGDGSSIGLIGRLGAHDNDPVSKRGSSPTVKNVAVKGSVRGNRSVGGIVGKIGKTSGGGYIDSCVNYASVSATDSKGVGGIVGSAWNGGKISNCYNAGSVSRTGAWAAGGIAGTDEILIENCYNIGTITGPSGYAMALGTNNGGGTVSNVYYLENSAADGGWYTGGTFDKTGERTSTYMKTDEFVTLMGSAFKKDTKAINSGYPVLLWQEGDPVDTSDRLEPEAKVANGVASASVTEDEVKGAIKGAQKNNKDAVTIAPKIPANAVYNTVAVTLPTVSAKDIAEAKLGLNIETPLGDMKFNTKAVSSIAANAKGDEITISITEVESSSLTAKQKESVKERPVIELEVRSGNQLITNLGSGSVEVSIPYTLKSGETASGIKVYSVADDGTLTEIVSSYNTSTKRVTFTTSTLGKYVIDYDAGEWVNPYIDVKETSWYYEAVKFVSIRGLMTGTTADRFAPNANMTRAMFATVLYRYEGEPGIAGSANPFSDVERGKWYSDAVLWASANGIVEGYGDGRFGINDDITREQLVAMLNRYAKYKGYGAAATASLGAYSDADRVHSYALEPMKWAVQAEIVNGYKDKTIKPRGTATRAEVATMIMRFILNVAEKK